MLDDVDGYGIGGTVYVLYAGSEVAVQCFPPDALALALRAGVPIYATTRAMARAQPPPPNEVGAWLDRVSPADF